MISSRVILALLSYIEPLPRKKANPGNTFEWKINQIEDLQLHALAALSILLPRSLKEYFEYHVGTRLLIFYEWTINDGKRKEKVFKVIMFFVYSDEYKSQGNCFFGKGGRNTKRSQLKNILRLFRSLLSTRDERICMDLSDQGIIPSITGLI
jgi:hypothetical protein